MTRDADFKKLVRARMAATGENYTTARERFVAATAATDASGVRDERSTSHESGPVLRDGARVAALLSGSVAARHERVVRSSFQGRVLVRVPAKRTTRMAVLLDLTALFSAGRAYPEAEVTRVVSAAHPDHATLRRELVNAGYLDRADGVYELASAPPARDARWAHEFPSYEREWFDALWQRPDQARTS